jgi:hypothetical protein
MRVLKQETPCWIAVFRSFANASGVCTPSAFAAGMPVECLLTTTRAAAFQSAAAYFLAVLWSMIPARVRYQRGAVLPGVLWVITARLPAIPWTIAWTANGGHSARAASGHPI